MSTVAQLLVSIAIEADLLHDHVGSMHSQTVNHVFFSLFLFLLLCDWLEVRIVVRERETESISCGAYYGHTKCLRKHNGAAKDEGKLAEVFARQGMEPKQESLQWTNT